MQTQTTISTKSGLVIPQILSLLLIILGLPVAKLAGIAFDIPEVNNGIGVWLVVGPIWLFPIVVVACSAYAWLHYAKRSYSRAHIASWAPLVYATAVIFILLALAIAAPFVR